MQLGRDETTEVVQDIVVESALPQLGPHGRDASLNSLSDIGDALAAGGSIHTHLLEQDFPMPGSDLIGLPLAAYPHRQIAVQTAVHLG